MKPEYTFAVIRKKADNSARMRLCAVELCKDYPIGSLYAFYKIVYSDDGSIERMEEFTNNRVVNPASPAIWEAVFSDEYFYEVVESNITNFKKFWSDAKKQMIEETKQRNL